MKNSFIMRQSSYSYASMMISQYLNRFVNIDINVFKFLSQCKSIHNYFKCLLLLFFPNPRQILLDKSCQWFHLVHKLHNKLYIIIVECLILLYLEQISQLFIHGIFVSTIILPSSYLIQIHIYCICQYITSLIVVSFCIWDLYFSDYRYSLLFNNYSILHLINLM